MHVCSSICNLGQQYYIMAAINEADKTPVILNVGLQGTDVERTLNNQFKVRVSSSTQAQTCIFPKSGIAFLVLPLADSLTLWLPSTHAKLSEQVTQRVEKLVSVHAHSYVICVATFHGAAEMEAIALLQQQFLMTTLQVIPAHGMVEAAQCMTTLAKALCAPMKDALQTQLYASLKLHVAPDNITRAIQESTGISEQEINILVDRLGSLQRIATASREELSDCPLSKQTINKVHHFFHQDKA